MSTTTAYKVFTHDLRPPVRGGEPVWSGALPHRLPVIDVDLSGAECAHGWNACATAEDALSIAGFWPDGRPSRLYRVETEIEVISRGDKLRAATWTITEELQVDDAIRSLSRRWFGDLHEVMADEQLAWRAALARPMRDQALVEQGLAMALDARGLQWSIKRFRSARDARVAWDARDARDAWDARDARAALTTQYASRRGMISCRPDRHTIGIRDAYHAGLGIALPTGMDELGWAMD